MPFQSYYLQTTLDNTKLSVDYARTLLQAKWSAVFLELSCKVRSALALLTSTSGGNKDLYQLKAHSAKF